MNDAANAYCEMYVWRATDFFTSKFFAYRDDQLSQINKPDSAEAAVQQGWILLRLKEDWVIDDNTYSTGSLLIGKVANNTAQDHEFQVLFEPSQNRILESWSVTNETILLQISENVCSRLYLATESSAGWELQRESTDTTLVNETGQALDSLTSSRFLVRDGSFTMPPQHYSFGHSSGPLHKSSNVPCFFDSAAFTTTQHWAISADGTKVPYFETNCINSRGEQPALLYGYGGFEISLLPTYAPNMGVGWLERGGVYIVANIRGGGEFGPAWHHAPPTSVTRPMKISSPSPNI